MRIALFAAIVYNIFNRASNVVTLVCYLGAAQAISTCMFAAIGYGLTGAPAKKSIDRIATT